MDKRIELEIRGRNHDQIKDLNLDNCRSPNIVGLDDSFTNLEILSMINTGLTSLKGFPNLPKLRRLELSDNRISNGLNHLKGSTNLEYLNLCGNKIKDIETLEPLKDLENLITLDLFNCEVTELPDYRSKVFSMLPKLKYLDGYDKDNQEIEDEEEEDVGEDFDECDEDAQIGSDEEDNEDDVVDEADEEEDDDEEDEEIGLKYLQSDKVLEEDNEDFVPCEDADEEDDLIDEEDEEDEPEAKGVKRKAPEDE